jgi:hypothetical protein
MKEEKPKNPKNAYERPVFKKLGVLRDLTKRKRS